MRKNYLFIIAMVAFTQAMAVQHTITISGFTYSPSSLNAAVGDTINFPASGTHPMVQVDQATWNANGATPVSGGFGVQTASFQYQILMPGDIYFVCQNHVSLGMKGVVLVTASNISELIGQNNVKLLSNIVRNNYVTVMNSTDRQGELIIYDLSGKVIDMVQVAKDAKQLLSLELPKGVYLYRFNMEGMWTQAERLYMSKEL